MTKLDMKLDLLDPDLTSGEDGLFFFFGRKAKVAVTLTLGKNFIYLFIFNFLFLHKFNS